jgi:transcription elongation GreA/GreB family factor
MERSNTKAIVVRAAIGHLRAMEKELRERVGELKAVTIGDDNAESASQTESLHGSDIDVMNGLGGQIEHILRDIALLESIDPAEQHSTVRFGSLVRTDQRDLLVATGIEEFKVNGSSYLGLSPRAPLFQQLSGAKAGDTVEFNKVKYRVLEVL